MNREMKDVGLSWLGNIPKHWDLIRCGDLFRQRTAKGRNTEDMLTCSIAGGVVPQKVYEEMTGRKLSKPVTDKDNYRKVLKGDLVYNKMRMWQGAVGYSEYSGVVSPAYVVMSCEDDTATQYSSWLFKSSGFNEQSNSNSSGICDDQNSLSFEVFRQMLMPLPPRSEMAKITTYLCIESHHTDAEIDLLNRKIDLLREQRKAIIFEAVAKGLDPDAPMKESGVEWTDTTPAHWGLVRVGEMAAPGTTFRDGDWVELPYIGSEGYSFIQTGNIGEGRFKHQGGRFVSDENFIKLKCFEIQPDDVLMCRLAAPVGRACLAPSNIGPMITCVDNAILRCDRAKVLPNYANYLFNNPGYLLWMADQCQGATRSRVARVWLSKVALPLPPINEQQEIVTYLNQETGMLDSEIKLLQRKIDLLQEQRKALIFEAVTGKIDLSNYQPRTTQN